MTRGIINELPRDTHKRNVAEFFSQSTRYWAEAYSNSDREGDSFDAYAKQRRKELVLDFLDRHANGRQLALLDVGCGPGLFLEEAKSRGHEVYGIDLSESMVREANTRLGQLSTGRTPCLHGDIESLPFESGSMDVIMCLGVLPYLRDDGAAVAEIGRVLKDGGFVIVVLPNLVKIGNLLDPYYYLVRGWQYVWYRLFKARTGIGHSLDPDRFGSNRMFGIRRYTAAQIRTLFSQPWLSIVENRGIDYGPFTLWKRRFMSNGVSIKISELLASTGQRTLLSWMAGMANECVLCVTINKKSQGQGSI